MVRLPTSCTVAMASSCHVSDVSIAIGGNMCVHVMAVYFVHLSSAALFSAAPATRDVSLISVNVSGVRTEFRSDSGDAA